MTQYFDAAGYQEAIAEAGPPPGDAEAACRSPEYLRLFYRWVEDNAADPAASAFLLAVTSINEGASLDAVWERTGNELAMIQAPWSAWVLSQVQMRTAESDDNAILGSMWREAVTYLEDVYPQFLAFVNENRTIDISSPEQVEFTLDMIDRDYVRSVNEYVLKHMDEDQQTYLWQSGDVILIGNREEIQLSYRKAVEKANGWGDESDGNHMTGFVEMISKGGLTTRGKIQVRGCPDPDAFKAHLRQFSKKEVVFR